MSCKRLLIVTLRRLVKIVWITVCISLANFVDNHFRRLDLMRDSLFNGRSLSTAGFDQVLGTSDDTIMVRSRLDADHLLLV